MRAHVSLTRPQQGLLARLDRPCRRHTSARGAASAGGYPAGISIRRAKESDLPQVGALIAEVGYSPVPARSGWVAPDWVLEA